MDEFNYWYNHMHVPDFTAPGVFNHAIRFENSDPNSPAGQYVVTYETSREDVSKAMGTQMERYAELTEGMDRMTPLIEMVMRGPFKRIGGEFSAARREVRGILLVLSNRSDSASEKDFNRWYEDIHIPDILDIGAFHTAYRYESLDPESTGAKYVAIYETDNLDPAEARKAHADASADWERRGRLFDGLEVVSSLTARRIWPED